MAEGTLGAAPVPVEVVRLAARPALALRVRAAAPASLTRVGRAVGVALPREPGRAAGTGPRALSLAPGEWLVFGAVLTHRLEAALGGLLGLAVDVGDAWVGYAVSGPAARDLLAKGTSLDLHPREWPVDQCGQTMFAQIHALIDRPAAGPGFEVWADSSLRRHLDLWFADAVLEFGCRSQPQ